MVTQWIKISCLACLLYSEVCYMEACNEKGLQRLCKVIFMHRFKEVRGAICCASCD